MEVPETGQPESQLDPNDFNRRVWKGRLRGLRTFAFVALIAAGAALLPQYISLPKSVSAADTAQLTKKARELKALGRYQEASDEYARIVKEHPDNAAVRAEWGHLFFERYTYGEASKLFGEALEIDQDNAQALYGQALLAADGFESAAVELAKKALKSDPQLVEAQELLAKLALEDSNPKKAIEEADKALEISPNALQAMAIRATIDWLDQKNPDLNQPNEWMQKALAKDPKFGQGYETAGHFFVLNRRYEEGIELYRRAVEIKPDLWTARSQLGVNLMRLGLEDEAREQLEMSFKNGLSDSPTVNTLRLMDSYKNFESFTEGNMTVRVHKKEADLVAPYFLSELRRALDTYEKKYKLKLERPVQLEVYPDHEDFAVRTMGMPGLGALGVTFGYVVAMDSPSGRKPGSFHWASTLWHEFSHVYVLAATKHLVPRWFTEGMAVHEETAVAPDWGDRLDPQAIMAIKDKKLLPIAELDRGFVRPSYPAQVVVSYFQAGRICDFINDKWGYDTLLGMMHSYAAGESTPDVIRKHLKIEPEEFDKQFLAKLEGDTKKIVEGFDEWRKGMKILASALREKQYDQVIEKAPELRDLYPDYVEAGSPYEMLATAYLEKDNKEAAIRELQAYSKIGGRSPMLIKKLGDLLTEAGRPKEAIAALERMNYIYLHDEELHRKLGALLLENGKPEKAVVEFKAALALNPLDPATAHYNAARALKATGKNSEAQDQLISALESAPGFRPAQQLLLELTEGETKK